MLFHLGSFPHIALHGTSLAFRCPGGSYVLHNLLTAGLQTSQAARWSSICDRIGQCIVYDTYAPQNSLRF